MRLYTRIEIGKEERVILNVRKEELKEKMQKGNRKEEEISEILQKGQACVEPIMIECKEKGQIRQMYLEKTYMYIKPVFSTKGFKVPILLHQIKENRRFLKKGDMIEISFTGIKIRKGSSFWQRMKNIFSYS